MDDEETVKEKKDPNKYQEHVQDSDNGEGKEELKEEEEEEINEKGLGKNFTSFQKLEIRNCPQFSYQGDELSKLGIQQQLLTVTFYKHQLYIFIFVFIYNLSVSYNPNIFGTLAMSSDTLISSSSQQKPRNPMPGHHLIYSSSQQKPRNSMPGHGRPGKVIEKVWNKKKIHDKHFIPLPVDVWWEKHAED
ncbi:hypothetical protein ACFE04_016211 [Oxalis oulophora]